MKRSRRWAVVGLLCVCGAVGCAQLPARGLFARRAKAPTADELRVDETSAIDIDDDAQWRELANASERDADAADGSRSSGGQFDVAGHSSTDRSSSDIEAPTPKRRASATPAILTPPENARELQPGALENSIATVAHSSSDRADSGSSVVTADFTTSTAGGYSSDIELAAAKRQTNGAANPWDRFHNLTNNADHSQPAARPAEATDPLMNLNPANNRSSPMMNESATTQTRPTGANPPAVTQPQPWANNALAPGATNSVPNAAANNANAPELWPRAPGAAGYNATNNGANAPANVQWVNAEQTAVNSGVIQSFNAGPPSNASPFTPPASFPSNLTLPDGAPAAIVPFATSSELERLITQTTVEAAAMTPGDNELTRQFYLRKHVQLRLLHLISGQMDRALQPVPGIDPADQEFWQQMLWGMANYFDTQGMPDSSERATQTIAQLRAASARLQEKARLELHNVAFCHKISGFGNYQRFKRDEFTSGQPVLLYAEVGNFKSESTADGQFRTLMKSTLEILEGGPTGRLVESLPLAPSEDRCRSQRRDYYHSYEFAVPSGCNPGPHTLRLRVEDQLGKKTAVTTLNFTVQ